MPAAQIPLEDDHRKQAFIDWLVTPPVGREPRSQAELARQLGVAERTLVLWKANPEFRKAWQARSTEVIGTPDRAQAVLDGLFEAARDPKHRQFVQAAKLYLEAIDAIKPKRIEVSMSQEASKLTDAELDRLIALGASELKEARSNGT